MESPGCTFLDIKSTVHFEFIPQGQTVNQAYYMEILKQLCDTVCREGPQLWPNNWISTMTVLQLTRHSVGFWPKNQLLKWNTHPIPLIRF